jgi:hypothetical protein
MSNFFFLPKHFSFAAGVLSVVLLGSTAVFAQTVSTRLVGLTGSSGRVETREKEKRRRYVRSHLIRESCGSISSWSSSALTPRPLPLLGAGRARGAGCSGGATAACRICSTSALSDGIPAARYSASLARAACGGRSRKLRQLPRGESNMDEERCYLKAGSS